MKYQGVIFNSELNFVQHCKEKINTALFILRNYEEKFHVFRRRRFYRSLV